MGSEYRLVRSHHLLWAALTIAASCPGVLAQPSFRAFWADAFRAGYKSAAEVDTLVSRAVSGNYNAIIAEVLAYHDRGSVGHGAYWNSGIVPKANDIAAGFDPLAYLCQQAHANNIEVHAWIVTYRVSSSWPPSGNTAIPADGRWLMVQQANQGTIAKIENSYVLDPGSPEVQEYLISIVRELVTNYPIDGINWDYIRYEVTDAGYPAVNSYPLSTLARYNALSGSYASFSDFRRRTITELVRRARAEIPSIPNPQQPLRHTADLICFGSAPACGSFSSTSAYALYQDWRFWMEQGYLDAAIPMNYKRDHCPSEVNMYRSWVDRASCWKYGRHFFAGQANYLNSFENSAAQMQYALSSSSVDGAVNYSYAGTRANETVCENPAVDPWSNDTTWYTSYVPGNIYTSPAPAPEMPWRNPATATEGTVWGQIRNAATGLGVDHATVTFTMPRGHSATTQTDGNGYYVLTLMPAAAAGSNYNATISRTGFTTITYTGARILPGTVSRYDFTFGASSPAVIAVSPASFVRSVGFGSHLASDTFTVTNQGGGSSAPLNYAISDNASWLEVSPAGGTSSGETDNLTINYNTAGLAYGNYPAVITISDPAAVNSPQTISVTLTVTAPSIPGDFDFDRDVDQEDFAFFQKCMTGPFVSTPPPGCGGADLDGDGDIDDADFTRFFNCMSGPNIEGNAACNN